MENNISKEQARRVSAKIKEAVEVIFREENLEVGRVSTGYGDIFKFTVQATPVEVGLNGINLKSEYAVTHEALAGILGVEAVPLGTKFAARGGKSGQTVEYFYAGIASKRSKFPFAAKEVSGEGRIFFFPESAKANLLRAAKDAQNAEVLS